MRINSILRRLALLATAAAVLGCAASAAHGGPARPTRRPAGEARAVRLQESAGRIASAARAYLAALARGHHFSGSVLVSRDGRVLYQGAYGWADSARHIPNRTTTRFRIASVSKAFTAMAILQLQDEGRLKVTDPVCALIDRCPAAWRAITVQELLDHSSGIPDYENLHSYPRLSRLHLSPEQLVDLVRPLPLEFAPGSRWRYSNSGYAILGLIIERSTGHRLAGYLKTHIFNPLGLRATSYDVNHPPVATHATGYAGPGRPAPYIDISTVYAAGAIASTVDDLNRWDQALMTSHPRLLQAASLPAMFAPHIPINPAYPRLGSYGDGWFIDNGGAEYDHDGLFNGFVTFSAIFPQAHSTVIVLDNDQQDDPRTITDHLAGLLGLRAY
jgi:CubicO group peptidase (beta-lactamase class C family)